MSLTWSGDRVIASVNDRKKQALTAGATIVEAEAKVRAPVDTGQLRGSIGYEVGESEAKIGTIVDYSIFVEFGTSRQRPQPYLRPAIDENTDKIKQVMADILKGAFR